MSNDFTDYTELKESGIAEIIKDSSNNFVMIRKKWKTETGELDTPEISLINVESLAEKKAAILAEAQKKADALDVVISEVKDLDTK